MLHEFKARLTDLKARGEALAIRASDYAARKQTQDAKAGQYEEALALRNSLQVRMDEIKRQLGALPRLRELRSLRESLAPLTDLPEAPFGWVEALRELQENEVALATRMQGVEADIARLASELDAAPPDEPALALVPRVQQLADLRARHTTAEKDIPERRSECRDAALAVAGILARIDRSDEADPQRLLLSAAIVGPLRELIERRSGIEACLEAAEREAKNAAQRLREVEAGLRDAGEAASQVRRLSTLASLAAAVDALRCSGHAARLSHAERSHATCLEALARQMRLLAPWEGEADQLARMAVPALSEVEGWRTAIQHSEHRIEQAQVEIDRLAVECARHEAKRAAMDGVGVLCEREAAATRVERERAWSEHRRQLDAATAESFETALRRDDAFMAARLGQESEIAAVRQLAEAMAVAEAELNHARSLRDREQNALHEHRTTIAMALRSISPALADMAPSRLEAWLDRRSKALDAKASLAEAESDLRMARADTEAARQRLMTALTTCGVPHVPEDGADTLLATAQATIDREAQLAALRREIEDRKRALVDRRRDAEEAAEADRNWQDAWRAQCAGCWLGEGDPAPSLKTVQLVLEAVGERGQPLERQAGLMERIARMEADQRRFAREVADMATALGIEKPDEDVLEIDRAIGRRIQQAQTMQAQQQLATDALETVRKRQRELQETLAIHQSRKAEMTAHFAVASLAEVGDKLRDIERRTDLQRQADNATRDILDGLRFPTLDQAERVLEAADAAALEAGLADAAGRHQDQDQRVQELFMGSNKARDDLEAVGGDDAVARIEGERRTLLLEIEEGALRALKIRLGVAAAEQGLRVYRERHRSSMLAQASEAFRTISRGAYTGLATQPGKDGDMLIAQSHEGGSKIASELSKGTRFQLYLALRAAGHHEFAASRRPPPFVADDIMETFDDFRAEEAFRLFGRMAEAGQIVYLTHQPAPVRDRAACLPIGDGA